MHLVLGGVLLALAFVIVGVVAIGRELPRLRAHMKRLEASLAIIPIVKAAADLERLERSLNGLQLLAGRISRKK